MPAPETKRLFVAIEVPDQVVQALEPVRLSFRDAGLRPVRIEQVHLTLSFIGDLDARKVEGLSSQLAAIGTRPRLKLSALGVGVFPQKGRTRVGWVGISDRSGALNRIQNEVAEACRPYAADREDRGFSAHLTLGRTPKNGRVDEQVIRQTIERWNGTAFGRWTATEFVLFSSEPDGAGRRYVALQRFPIAAGP
jgi:2'-5' RNA ligase